MADILEIKRRENILPQLGALLAQPFAQQQAQQQSMYQTLLPVIFKAQMEKQQQNELIDKLIQGGNGPMGDFDISIGPSGVTYKQKSPKEKMEEQVVGRATGLAKVLPYIQGASRRGASEGVMDKATARYSTPEEVKSIMGAYSTGQKLRPKKSPLIIKKELDTAELGKNAVKLIDLFRNAQGEGKSYIRGFGEAGPQSRVAGGMADIIGKFGSSKLPNLNVYNRESKAFATTVAKAAGEVRPTDQDIRRFMGTLPSTKLSDQENEILIQQLSQDMENKGFKGMWIERTGKKAMGGKTKSGLTYTIEK